MKDKLEKLLDNVYELEGLLHLAINKEDLPPRLLDLIKIKTAEAMETVRRELAIDSAESSPVSDPAEVESTAEYVVEEGKTEEVCQDATEEEKDTGIEIKGEKRRSGIVLSLNDRFMFSRELFGGHAGRLSATLEALSHFEDYDAAATWLREEYGIVEDDEIGAIFLDRVKTSFA